MGIFLEVYFHYSVDNSFPYLLRKTMNRKEFLGTLMAALVARKLPVTEPLPPMPRELLKTAVFTHKPMKLGFLVTAEMMKDDIYSKDFETLRSPYITDPDAWVYLYPEDAPHSHDVDP